MTPVERMDALGRYLTQIEAGYHSQSALSDLFIRSHDQYVPLEEMEKAGCLNQSELARWQVIKANCEPYRTEMFLETFLSN